MIDLTIAYPIDFLDEVRVTLGLTSDDLYDDEIMSLSLAGAAELDLISLVPNAKSILEDSNTEPVIIMQLTLVMINLVAYYAYPTLKTKLLLTESDNKTFGTRFKDALSRDRNEYKAVAIKSLDAVGITPVMPDYDRISISTPDIDVITGNEYT